MGTLHSTENKITLSYPNEDFFNKFHQKDSSKEDKTLLEKAQVLAIRHGYSEFNHAASIYHAGSDKSHDAFMSFWAARHLVDPVLH